MVASGRGPDGQEPALTGGPLSSFGLFSPGSNVYYIGTNMSVHQLTNAGGSWAANDLLSSAAPGSQLVSQALYGSYPRVYYVDSESRLAELAWRTGQWNIQYLPGEPADDSPLAGPLWLEDNCYLFYVGTDRRIHQLQGDLTGNFSPRFFPPVHVAPGGSLTATTSGDTVQVFYPGDADMGLLGIGLYPLAGPFNHFFIDTGGTDPAAGSALTCCTMTDTGATHVYFADPENWLNELIITGQVGTTQTLPGKARPGSALTCFGVNGELPRLYYLDEQAQVNELAWVHGTPAHWAPNPLGYTAAGDSALACYGYEGQWTRLYFLSPDHRVNELAWDNTSGKFGHTGL